MFGFFKSKKTEPEVNKPNVMGLAVGASFELDTLGIKLILDQLTISEVGKTHIIQAAGMVELDGNYILRFYTDDDAWLQVVCEGKVSEENVIDVKLFYYFDTQDIVSEQIWNDLLDKQIGQPEYQLNEQSFHRVWTSASEYHNPVHMREQTYDNSNTPSETDQFTMLFERPLDDGSFEALFVSAEESVDEHQNLNRCLVTSTGINISPSQITIHG